MVRQCAWCKKRMGVAPGPEDSVSHGMCDQCVAEWERQGIYDRRVRKLRQMLNSATPAFVVAMQCWLVIVAYKGGKWRATWWLAKRSLRDLVNWLPWRHRKIERATEATRIQ